MGFALETENEEVNAQAKLIRKKLDYIVLNSLRDPGAGFGTVLLAVVLGIGAVFLVMYFISRMGR